MLKVILELTAMKGATKTLNKTFDDKMALDHYRDAVELNGLRCRIVEQSYVGVSSSRRRARVGVNV